ncbi:MAG: phosphate/phosphite/phosphonate ABC transporter substrate-binding protein [Rhodoferax sp.]|nr:phosphate/phosphite/phosphonate ABC transporter substrate-binding protein [Rhodoferax sp.]
MSPKSANTIPFQVSWKLGVSLTIFFRFTVAALNKALLITLPLTACQQQAADKPLEYSTEPAHVATPVYRLVPHPLYNPQTLSKLFQPLVDHINGKLQGGHLELEASRDYQSFEQKFLTREAEFLMPNPWQTIEAQKVGYQVMAMWGDAENFKGLLIVRKDSPVKTPADLKGRTVSYPSSTALAAAIMPQYFLHTQGINVNSDIHNIYVGSQMSSIMNVYLGQVAAGATWPPPWNLFQKEHPTEAAQLKVIWETPSLVNNSVMVRNDVPVAISQQVRQTLLDLTETPEGQKILAGMETARFHAANDANYDVVRTYIKRFETEVRPIKQP